MVKKTFSKGSEAKPLKDKKAMSVLVFIRADIQRRLLLY